MSTGLRLYVEQISLEGKELQLLNIRFEMRQYLPPRNTRGDGRKEEI